MTPELPREKARRLIAAVAARHGLHPCDLYERSRWRHIATARTEAMRTVAAEYPRWSCTQLAAIFRRDHTTVLHALGRTTRARRLTAVKDAPTSMRVNASDGERTCRSSGPVGSVIADLKPSARGVISARPSTGVIGTTGEANADRSFTT